jgi:hypothetical protein
MKSKIFQTVMLGVAIIGSAVVFAGCGEDADVASRNLSKAADNFEIQRRVVFFNGITDKYLLVIEGRCSLGNDDPKHLRTVTCKVGKDEYKKHFVGLSDNVSYFVEQMEAEKVSVYRYRVTFKPSVIVPDIDLRVGGEDDKAASEPDTSKPDVIRPEEDSNAKVAKLEAERAKIEAELADLKQ